MLFCFLKPFKLRSNKANMLVQHYPLSINSSCNIVSLVLRSPTLPLDHGRSGMIGQHRAAKVVKVGLFASTSILTNLDRVLYIGFN